jgi:FixJ family two-component response regulator
MRKHNCVYVIDKNASARAGLVRLLAAAGFNVKSYEYAVDFLHEYSSDYSGCILMDPDMTGISGENFMAEFYERELDLPVIILCSKDDKKIKREPWVSRARYFFRKPVDGSALIDAIDWLLISNSKKGTEHGK